MGVKVLGTSFNVSAYREDVEKSVVLVTGKVEVTASNGESVRIYPMTGSGNPLINMW